MFLVVITMGMSLQNVTEAWQWIQEGTPWCVVDETVVKEGTLQGFYRQCRKSLLGREVEKLVPLITKAFQDAHGDAEARTCKDLCDYCIVHYQGQRYGEKCNQCLRDLDRLLSRERPGGTFLHKDNKSLHDRWIRDGYPQEIFFQYPDFCDFLSSSQLLSQMKVTRDTIRVLDGQVCLLVEGRWTPWPEINERFEWVYSARYRDKFIRSRDTYEVFTYLDNGLGLQRHHPYIDALRPVSNLGQAALATTLEKAREFLRPEEVTLSPEQRAANNKTRNFIVQVVTSKEKSPNINVVSLFRGPRHAFLRLLAGEEMPEMGLSIGDVLDFGFWPKAREWTAGIAQVGNFRGPDAWEYVVAEERVVTHIAITREEARRLLTFATKYHRNAVNLGQEVNFNTAYQNCCVFVRTALAEANIDVPTKIYLFPLLWRMAPDWIQAIGRLFVAAQQHVKSLHGHVVALLPKFVSAGYVFVATTVQDIALRVYSAAFAFILTPVRIFLSGVPINGDSGEVFARKTESLQDADIPYRNWKDLFRLSKHHYNVPFVVQEWQLAQPSTVVHPHPLRLTISA